MNTTVANIRKFPSMKKNTSISFGGLVRNNKKIGDRLSKRIEEAEKNYKEGKGIISSMDEFREKFFGDIRRKNKNNK